MSKPESGGVREVGAEPASTPASVLIVDDHPLVREGLRARIGSQPDMFVCGEASNVDEAMALVDARSPDIVIVDLALDNSNGLDLIKKVARRNSATKMLVLSAREESVFAERALAAGALGYVSKQEAQNKIIDCIRTVLRGEHCLSSAMTQKLLQRATGEGQTARGVESLSNRELEVFQLIGQGNNTRGIAEQLHLSIHTIETHRENIRAKLSLSNGAELVQRAVQWMLESR